MSEEQQSQGGEAVSGRLRPQVDLFVGLALILVGVFVVIEAGRMPGAEHPRVRAMYEGPGFVPGLLGATLCLFGGLIIVRSIREGGLRLEGSVGRATTLLAQPEVRRLAILLLLALIYVGGLIGRVSFPLATFPFVLAFILVYDWENTPERAEQESWVVTVLRRVGIEIDWSVRREQVLLVGTAAVQAALTAWAITYVFEEIFLRRLP